MLSFFFKKTVRAKAVIKPLFVLSNSLLVFFQIFKFLPNKWKPLIGLC